MKAQLPLDEERVQAYEQLMEAQHRIAARLARVGVNNGLVERAMKDAEPAHPERLAPEEIYLGTLSRFVAILGGELKLAAVFGDEADGAPFQ